MGRPKIIFTQAETDYLVNNYQLTSYDEMSRILNCSHQVIRRKMKRLGLRKIYGKKQVHIDIMEDFFALRLTMPEIAKKRSVNYGIVNQVVKQGFKLKESENTKIITLKSKV